MHTFEYVDFNLTFSSVEQGYRVKADCNLSGEASGVFTPPFTANEIKKFIREMGFHRSEEEQTLKATTEREKSAQSFGQRLFETALPLPVRDRLLSALSHFHDGKVPGLRLKFHLTETPELVDLPWEFLYLGEDYDFPALSARTPIVRYPDVPRPVPPLEVTLPLRVLALVMRPVGYIIPDPDRERESLNRALAPLMAKDQVKVDWLVNPTREQLQRQLRREPYHALHFVGHGRFDPNTQDGYLILANRLGQEDKIDSVRLRRLLGDSPTLRLAVLIACEGARTGTADPFASVAATLVRGGIPAVVAMQFEITYGAAAIFEAALYEALADRLPVDAAVGEGRRAMDLQRPGTVEWGIPVLYLRSPDGRIFDVITAPPRPKPSPELDDLYSQALGYFHDQQMEKALSLLEDITAKAPGYPGASEKLEIARQVAVLENEARLLKQAGRWKEVLGVLERIGSVMPEYGDPHRYRVWAEEKCRRDLPNLLYHQGLESLLPEEREEFAGIDGEYGLRHLASELADAGRWETLHRLVAEGTDRQPWAEARREMHKSYTAYLTDLSIAWRHAEEAGLEQARHGDPITAIGKQVRYTAIASSLHFILSYKRLEEYEALLILSNILAVLGSGLSSRPDLLDQAIDAVQRINTGRYRQRSIAFARHIDYIRSSAIVALGPVLAGQPDLMAHALDVIRSIESEDCRSEALVALAPGLAGQPDLLRQALDVIRSIYPGVDRSEALVALAPGLAGQSDLLAEALDAALSIDASDDRSRALAVLASHLPNDQRQEVLVQVLDAVKIVRTRDGEAWIVRSSSKCSQALVALAPSLAGQPELLAQALDAARSIDDSDHRVLALAALASHLPDDQQQEVLTEALDIARNFSSSLDCSQALAALAPYLPNKLYHEVLAEALDAACSVEMEDYSSRALTALAPSLAGQPELLAQALDAARSIDDSDHRASALAALIPYLSDDLLQRQEVLTEALDGARSIQQEALAEALDAAPYIDDIYDRSRTLVALASTLARYSDLRVQLYRYWIEMLRASSAHPRPEFLSILAAETPILIALGGEQAAIEAAQAVVDVHRWWPNPEPEPERGGQVGTLG
jgi:hypothetical protein